MFSICPFKHWMVDTGLTLMQDGLNDSEDNTMFKRLLIRLDAAVGRFKSIPSSWVLKLSRHRKEESMCAILKFSLELHLETFV